ncbi:MAG: hypothetical protein Q4B14_00380 [Clostridia bacterium]|nr:hypothetical protein [Clostridia bacterium]
MPKLINRFSQNSVTLEWLKAGQAEQTHYPRRFYPKNPLPHKAFRGRNGYFLFGLVKAKTRFRFPLPKACFSLIMPVSFLSHNSFSIHHK